MVALDWRKRGKASHRRSKQQGEEERVERENSHRKRPFQFVSSERGIKAEEGKEKVVIGHGE